QPERLTQAAAPGQERERRRVLTLVDILLVHLLLFGLEDLDLLGVGDDAVAVVLVAPAHLAGLLEHHLTVGVLVLVVLLDPVALLETSLIGLGLVVEVLDALRDLFGARALGFRVLGGRSRLGVCLR